MSHIVVYMGIPFAKVNGDTSETHIQTIVEDILSKYVEDTAEDEYMIKMDWYEIGGRWAGAFGTMKGAASAYPTENGVFAYKEMQNYDVVCNKGKHGPYIAGDKEFIPVNGAYKKDIAWDAVSRLSEYYLHRIMLQILNKEKPFADNTPDWCEIQNDALYANNDEHTLLVTRGETFEDRVKRLGQTFGRSMAAPDAYVDLSGHWHDVNGIWAEWEAGGSKAMKEIFDSDKDPEEIAQEQFNAAFDKFLDSMQDDDYFIVVDGHTFP